MNEASAAAPTASVDLLAINSLRFLAVDMVEAAGCGHPGAPMGQAALAYWLWTRHLRHDPAEPEWLNRDRFVLSCGHASALLYGLLHLSGYDLPMAELRNFRQLGSKTAGHPEYGHAPGIETTTGPLGQGFANAVGMALAESHLAARFNRPDFPVFDHRTWVLASDGDLMEGIASEAASLAGHWGLGKLNVFYDANEITIDGSTNLAFSEDVAQRFESFGWHIERVDDGNDLVAIDRAIKSARGEAERPTLIVTRTRIGFGSPNRENTSKAHGEALGAEEARLTKEALGWPQEPTFHVPEEARQPFRAAAERGAGLSAEWRKMFERYRAAHGEPAAEIEARLAGEFPDELWKALPEFHPEDGPLATRKASGAVLNALAPQVPQLMGGSADLTGSNNTWINDAAVYSRDDRAGRNLHFGVREHAMGAIMNGMALSKLFIPYGGTFLIFSDYMRPPTRLAALMGIPGVFVFTHDSIFLGEDGPTHQPVGQLAALRAIPNVNVIRPADANETAGAWRLALEKRDGPTVLALTRQKLPISDELVDLGRDGALQGGYVLADPEHGQAPRALLIATGSEVSLALASYRELAREGIPVRVVSLPCWEIFDRQEASYRDSVLPRQITARLAIEAASSLGWHKYVGIDGDVLSVDRFGASAPAGDLAEAYGFTVAEVVRRVRFLLDLAG